MNEPTRASRRATTARRAAAVAVAAGVLLVGCTKPKPPTTTPTTKPGTPTGVTKFSDEAKRVQAATPDKRPYFCNGSGTGTPPSGHGNGSHVDPVYAGKTKGPLAWDVCLQLAGQLDQTYASVQGLETRAKGEAAGFQGFGQYLPGLGTHHGTFDRLTSTTFDPAKPTFLIYGGNGPESPLVGVAYRVANNPAAPPEGYVGGNDWYHKHSRVCTAPGLAGGEEVSDAECAALGGTNVTIPGGGDYLLHVWLPPYEYRPDMFVSGHPCLVAAGAAPQTDPCWEGARKDPSEIVTPPPTGGEHGGEHGH